VTITGNGGMNVVAVGSVNIQGGNTLTIRGGPGDRFVFNLTGSFNFSGGGRLILDGVTADQLLWNMTTGGKVEFSGSAKDPAGTFLDPMGEISIGPVSFYGTAIGRNVELHSGGREFCPSPKVCDCGCGSD